METDDAPSSGPPSRAVSLRLEFDLTDEAAVRELAKSLFGPRVAERAPIDVAIAMVLARTAGEAVQQVAGVRLRGTSVERFESDPGG